MFGSQKCEMWLADEVARQDYFRPNFLAAQCVGLKQPAPHSLTCLAFGA
jgi:hypothetical protein